MVNLLKSLHGLTARITLENGLFGNLQIGDVIADYVVCTAPAIPGIKYYIPLARIASVN